MTESRGWGLGMRLDINAFSCDVIAFESTKVNTVAILVNKNP